MPSLFASPVPGADMRFRPPTALTEQADGPATAPLRVLIADDDSSSRRFFSDGLTTLGARTDSCSNGREALVRARAESFDLLLLDCRMPGAGALEILTCLREDPNARSTDTLAVATTAELARQDQQPLIAAGFSEILMKPCGLSDLRRMLTLADRQETLLLDDSAALLTTGDAVTMRALRLLLHAELAALSIDLDTLGSNREGFADRLHRLRSSCGFCGAVTLSAQTALLQRQLAQAGSEPVALSRFRQALLATIQALDR